MFLKQKLLINRLTQSIVTERSHTLAQYQQIVFKNQSQTLLQKKFDYSYMSKYGFARSIFSKSEKSNDQGQQAASDVKVEEQTGGDMTATYRLLPVIDHPLFPGSSTALSLTHEQFLELQNTETVFASVVRNQSILKAQTDLVTLLNQGQQQLGLPQIKSIDDVYKVGVLCQAKAKEDKNNPYQPYMIHIYPTTKARLLEAIDQVAPLCRVRAIEMNEEKHLEEQLDISQSVVFKFLKQQYLKCYKIAPDQKFVAYLQFLESNFKVQFVEDFIYMLLTCVSLPQYINTYKFLVNIERDQIQEVYEEQNLTIKLEKMNSIFTDFVNKLDIWHKLEDQYDFRKDQVKSQKKLEEIYESLKKHFAKGSDEKEVQIQQFLKNLEGKTVPDHIMKVINEEIEKFMTMEKHHSDMQVSRTYLDYLTKLPYGVTTEENFDIKRAKDILDEGHYGLDDVKKRILEFIAVGKLQNSVHGKILCFVGPPGVGKTSIGDSIAQALGRKFVRIAMGGDRDTSSLKGFRRTYVGSVPGKIVRALKTAEVENPVLLIDEVDKLGQRSQQGDPGSALLEILDPEQNKSFTDDYLDVPIDLSKVLFLCTANMLDTLHPALLDRMEIIRIAGYTGAEKRHILDKYLLPEAIKNAGLKEYQHRFVITDEVKSSIIENYSREPGMRSLKKLINRICEKIAFKIVDSEEQNEIKIDENNIEDYIGHPHFQSNRFYGKDVPPGVVIGLAYNEYGGSILYIEALQSSLSQAGKGTLKVTGSLGDVMKESSSIAQTYAKNFLFKNLSNKYPDAGKFLEHHDLHIHFPEGAVKKDGPSAGITITTAMISLALGIPIKEEIGMTGEISLNGKVLPIGGVKEKTMAATREGIKKLIFPKANEKDVQKLPDYIKNGIEFHFVDEYPDVFKILFPDVTF